ncbi:O-methyltransferase [Fodinibius salsisoli]|uniref:Class I SAM-dependent methyltransferase n=1 Tax=Fodinibius salsisoli TaxID=2820877 RepID=A0ABT3PLT9_9BACT|nr:class I SAM-dependent methyltransferase [Fodinibius salsisoli]MCW9706723.1 class I SAM-dependent methyltransferase [Fodinibius salsisoli]
MKSASSPTVPDTYSAIKAESEEVGFSMPSDLFIGSLLQTLTASKPASNILELGTGTGLSASWILNGMDDDSQLTSIDKNPELVKIAQKHLGDDERISILCEDAAMWLENYTGESFDIIFADAWPGKYSQIDITLGLLHTGGFYIIDDMLPQPNWPDGHSKNVANLITYLEKQNNLTISKLDCSTGILIAVKNN